MSDMSNFLNLSKNCFQEVTTVRRNLGTQGLEVDNELVRETWYPVFRRSFLRQALGRCYDCRKGFWMYQQVTLISFYFTKLDPAL